MPLIAVRISLMFGKSRISDGFFDASLNALANTKSMNNNKYVGASQKLMKEILPKIKAVNPNPKGFCVSHLRLQSNEEKNILAINDKNSTKKGNDNTWGCKSPNIKLNRGNSVIV